jgi:hypothetical protein
VEFEGDFETHLTVRPPDAAGIEVMRTWAAARGLKVLRIVLDRGSTPVQPMVTGRVTGRLTEQLAAAVDLAGQLAGLGLTVVRTKVEAAPSNRDIPQSDAEARDGHVGRYFEHHVKLALDPAADLTALAAVALRNGGHLSRNALREQGDGRRERFVTQRCHGVGRQTAKGRLDELLAALAALGHPIVDVEEEFVAYDSNIEVDAGWIDAAPAAPDPPAAMPG